MTCTPFAEYSFWNVTRAGSLHMTGKGQVKETTMKLCALLGAMALLLGSLVLGHGKTKRSSFHPIVVTGEQLVTQVKVGQSGYRPVAIALR